MFSVCPPGGYWFTNGILLVKARKRTSTVTFLPHSPDYLFLEHHEYPFVENCHQDSPMLGTLLEMFQQKDLARIQRSLGTGDQYSRFPRSSGAMPHPDAYW